MWYAALVVVTLATGEVDAYVADRAFETEQACTAFIIEHDADFAPHKRDFAYVQTCVKPEGGQAL